MSIAYVDTSALVAIAFDEPCGSETGARLDGCSRLLSSNLLEAELRAAFAREQQEFDADVLSMIDWILPDRPLAGELARALKAGYLRGADLWHVATALYVAAKTSGDQLHNPRRPATGSGVSPRVSGGDRLDQCGFRRERGGVLEPGDHVT